MSNQIIAEWNGKELDAAALWEMMCQHDYIAVLPDPLGVRNVGKLIIGAYQGILVNRTVDLDSFNEIMRLRYWRVGEEIQSLLGISEIIDTIP